MGIREEFEKLDAIDRMMQLCGATYSEITRNYKIKSTGLYDVKACSFINGAWYAFQEQQKKIDEFVSIVHEAYMSDGNSSVEIVYDKIQELLK